MNPNRALDERCSLKQHTKIISSKRQSLVLSNECRSTTPLVVPGNYDLHSVYKRIDYSR